MESGAIFWFIYLFNFILIVFFLFFDENDDKEQLEINTFIQQACIKLLTLYIFTILNKYSYFELSIH